MSAHEHFRYTKRVVAGLVIALTIVAGSLAHAVSNIHVYA